jgi:hypothetical protein
LAKTLNTDLPLCFIGDLHGRLDTLHRIISAHPDHFYVFVGDMIHRKGFFSQRTSSSFSVLREVRAICDAGNGVAILGNNEYSILANLIKPIENVRKKELRSSLLELQRMSFEKRMSWLRWLQDLPYYTKINEYSVSHAYPSPTQLEMAVYGPRGGCWFKPPSSANEHLIDGCVHIFGHYGRPYISDQVKCIDATDFEQVGVYISDYNQFLTFY